MVDELQLDEIQCQEAIPELLDLNVRWLEEPIFPPELLGANCETPASGSLLEEACSLCI